MNGSTLVILCCNLSLALLAVADNESYFRNKNLATSKIWDNVADSSELERLLAAMISDYPASYTIIAEAADAGFERDVSNIIPPMWRDVNELTPRYFEKSPDDSLIVDVWNYMERMALYKYLIENIKNCEWEDNEAAYQIGIKSAYKRGVKEEFYDPKNILWGLPLQHGWQYSSGRLLNEANSTMISPSAWWADMNYYLSVIPYLGAMEAGVAPKITVKYNPDHQLFCDSVEHCPDVVAPWTNFFKLVTETAESCNIPSTVSDKHLVEGKYPVKKHTDFNLTAGMENLLGSLWDAHLHSIGVALPLFEAQLAMMPEPEAKFGRSWASVVDFIAGCHFLCDMLTTDVLQNLLPQRMLQDGDQAPFIQDMSRLQNRAVLFIDGLYALNTTTNGRTERLWAESMCTEEGRAYGREMITLGIYRPTILLADTLQLAEIMKAQNCTTLP